MNEKKTTRHSLLTIIVDCAIAGYALLLFFGGMYPSGQNWGMHHLAFYSPIVRFGLPLLILSLLIPTVKDSLVKYLEKITTNFRKQKKSSRYILVFLSVTIGGLLFWSGRTETHFLGDGYLCIRSMSSVANNPELFTNLREPFVSFVIFKLNNILSAFGTVNSIEFAYRITSIACGMIFMVLVWHLTKRITKELVDRILILLFLLATGTSQLFFGYVENYVLAYICIIGFVLASLAYLQRKAPIILPIIVFSFLIVIHFGSLIFFPALFPLIRESFRRKEIHRTIAAVATGIILIPALLWISDYSIEMFLIAPGKGSGQLVPLMKNSTMYFMYTLFSAEHAMDVLNLLLLFQPAAFVLLFASGWLWRNQKERSYEKLFLMLMMLTGAAFITMLNCDLGMSRDWDLLAPFGVVFSIAAVYGWYRQIQEPMERRSLFAALTVTALLQASLWIGINANENKAIQRLDLLQENTNWSIHAKYNLAEERAIFHKERKEPQKAALFYERAVELQPKHFRLLANLAEVYIETGDTLKAIDVYKRIESQGQANSGVHENLGILYALTQRFTDALHHWYLAESLDSTSATIALNIGVIIASHKNSRIKALPYFLKAIRHDPLYAQSYYYAARCYEEMGELETARKYYSRFNDLKLTRR